MGGNPPGFPKSKSWKQSAAVLSDIRESAQDNVQKPTLIISAVCTALFISNISSFCRVLSTNGLYFNKILVCLPLFLNGLPRWESKAAFSIPFPPSSLGISPSPNCRQIEMSGIQRSGKTANSPTVPIALFTSCETSDGLWHGRDGTCRDVTSAWHREFCPCDHMRRHVLLHSHSGPRAGG